ncbi:MAG: hypothetical protein KKH67_07745 [candidate division Zixibacteria bacterium]|nr:hypothetical protein [candidate division Zixibacteria bacterium]
MELSELVVVCISAFAAVFVLLSILAFVMRLILVVFPERESGGDATMIAAVASALSTVYPGTRITKIEEIK